MLQYYKSEVIYEYNIQMNNEFKVIKKSTMQVNSVPDWGHSTEISFEGTDPAEFEINAKFLNQALEFNQDKIFTKSKLVGSRHGSLLSVSDKSRWRLDLIGQSYQLMTNRRHSPPKVIEELINIFTDSLFTQNTRKPDFEDKDNGSEIFSNNGNMMLAIRNLHLPFYSFTEHDVKDDDEKVIGSFKDNVITELFIPDITFHPIALIRNLFLATINKSYVELDNPLVSIEMDLLCDSQGNKISFEDMEQDEFIDSDIDILKTIENAISKLDLAHSFHGKLRRTRKGEELVNPLDKELEKLRGDWGSPENFIQATHLRQFYNRNGLLFQLSQEDIKEIISHFECLCHLGFKSGSILKYSMSNLTSAKAALEKESEEYPSVFDEKKPSVE